MESWVKEKVAVKYLVLALLIAIGGLIWLELSKTQLFYPEFEKQLEAARLMEQSLRVIKEEREKLGIPIDLEVDPNQTGIIGEEITRLTTTLGKIESKRTSTNPNFAALLVRYYSAAGLKEGDIVAIGGSGSFPALILASLCAAETMGLRPLLIYSIGSSMYGANIPQFTFLVMHQTLVEEDLLSRALIAVSMGGELDLAHHMFYPDSVGLIEELAQSAGVEFIKEKTLAASIKRRMSLYHQHAGELGIKCFVNIGGASTNFGNTPSSLDFPNGLVLEPPMSPNDPERGLLFEYSALGLPVINLLNLNELAVKNGLPLDPLPLPPVGSGGVYYQVSYNRQLIGFILILEFLVLAYALKKNAAR